jgi:hypothetical protein
MKQLFSIIILIHVIAGCANGRFHKQPVKPSVYAISLESLERNRNKIHAKDPAVMDAYRVLLKDADKALLFGPVSVMEKKHLPPSGDKHDYMSLAPYHWPDPSKPGGVPYMRKDGQTNPEVLEYKDKEYLPKLCEAVHTLGLAYYFSGEKIYAKHAADLIRTWFLNPATKMNPNLDFAQAIKGVNTGRAAGMIDTRHLVKVVDGIGLLHGAKAWTVADQEGMKKWFTEFLQWMQTSKNGIDEMNAGNNHGAWYDAQRLSMALFTGNMDLAKKVVVSAQHRLDKQMDETGRFPKEMERTISLHYTAFVMNAFFTIAQMAEHTGIDLWNYTSPSGKSLRKAFDATLPYLTRKKNWEGQQIKDFDYEDGFTLLIKGDKMGCNNCRESIKDLAGEKAERLRIVLIN